MHIIVLCIRESVCLCVCVLGHLLSHGCWYDLFLVFFAPKEAFFDIISDKRKGM